MPDTLGKRAERKPCGTAKDSFFCDFFLFTLFFFSFIFNWKIVALQWCVGFCQQNQS